MEILRILFVLGFLAPGYYAMEIQPSVLPRNLDVYCKFCDGLSAVLDNFSYEDYDFWRTIDIQEKVRFFCSFCKKKVESTTKTTMTPETVTPSITTSTSPQPETSSVPTSTPLAPETSSVPPSTTSAPGTSSVPPSTTSAPGTSSVPPSTTSAPGTPSSSSENPPPGP